MPLGASRLSFLAKTAAEAAVEQRTAKTITAQGNAQVDTSQSYFGGASARFDGQGDYLDLSSQTIPLEGDYTFETWIRSDVIGSSDVILRIQTAADAFIGSFYLTNGKIATYIGGGGTAGTTVMSADTWYHLAWCRDNGVVRMYINGVQDTTRSYATDQSACNLYIGHFPNDANTRFNGWLDEIRISNVARYPDGTSFTPPTTPFVNDANTTLLIHADGTDGDTVFIDDNGDRAPNGIQAYNGAAISTSQNKFGSSSFVFDGVNDYISTPSNSNSNLYVNSTSSSPFTLEAWVYPTGLGGAIISDEITNQAGGYRVAYCLGMSNSGSVGFSGGGYYPWFGYYNGSWAGVSSNTALTTSTWSHVAAVFDGSNSKIYINGTDVTSGTQSSWATDVPNEILIGRRWDTDSNIYFNGYIDEVRISDTARYTSGFTAPTAAFTNDSNTVLLLHAEQQGPDATEIFDDNGQTLSGYTPPADDVATWDGTDFAEITDAFTSDGNTEFLCSWDGTNGQTSATDESSNSHTITFSGGSADISTERNRFGGASVDLNFSSTDSIYFGDAGTSAWYNQDTTIECWVYYDTLTGAQASNGLPRVLGSFVTFGGGNYWSFGAKDDGSLQFFYYQGSGNYVTSATGLISAGQWHHIAMTHDNTSGAIELFLDGKNVASGTKASGSFNNHGYIRLGNYSGTPDAHVDEIRISHTVRYTPVEATSDTSISFAGGDYGYIDAFPNTSTSNPYSFFGWVKFDSSNLSDNSFVFESFRNGISAFRIEKYQSKLMINSFNSSNSPMYRAQHNSTISGDTWYAVWGSLDPSSTSNRSFCYQQYGSSTVNVVTSSNSAFFVNITGSYQSGFYDEAKDIGIFARGANGAVASRGDLAEFWMDDVYRDFTSSANRQKFVDSSGYPVDLGSDGSTPFGAAPPIYIAGSDMLTNNRGDSGDNPTYVGSPPNGDAVGS